MFDSRNMLYVLTILEAIEKIKIYSQEFENESVDKEESVWKQN